MAHCCAFFHKDTAATNLPPYSRYHQTNENSSRSTTRKSRKCYLSVQNGFNKPSQQRLSPLCIQSVQISAKLDWHAICYSTAVAEHSLFSLHEVNQTKLGSKWYVNICWCCSIDSLVHRQKPNCNKTVASKMLPIQLLFIQILLEMAHADREIGSASWWRFPSRLALLRWSTQKHPK